MSYYQYGISPDLVERIKLKMKNPVAKERMKRALEGVTKYDLQDRTKVRNLIKSSAVILNEKLTAAQEEQIIQFVIAQKIDPKNTLHLIRLWSMFR
ncbi:stage VI sporulation protein F [Paenibacillus sediminis]|uniref:RAB protein geranylgeranyltransferase component A n=1 Tax=Paenibacillus sediminis TaxID=664909 RepID=A0ABS4GZ97_9BACL|nr:stage VI sporulation protein F [Paenibacillus sediminis]MBP1935584.1 RAB protein geranylgeranyltransferase component A [Paenibacillus sediminis]